MRAGQDCDRPIAVTAEELSELLLPQPRSLRSLDGVFRLADGMAIYRGGSLEPPEVAALERFRDLCATRLGVHLKVRGSTCSRSVGDIVVKVAADYRSRPQPPNLAGESARAAQGYRLRVLPERVEVLGRSPVGLFHAIQTLAQLRDLCGREWPGLEIDDAPDFATRGLSYDVSRGRVPTLDTLRELVDRLASLKINQLQLYVEHTFAFAFDPDISSGCSPLTAREIRELDAYCARRRIELVPSLASFGHMGRVLSLPRYRHLAEVSTDQRWEEMTWLQRVRGLTLDVTNPEARELLSSMYEEYLPLFSSGRVNVCCDETFDLGQGRGKPRADQIGVGGLFLEHLRWLHQLCRRQGKQIMFWGDMVKKHPGLLREIPKDAVVLNWNYLADGDFDSTALFREAGLTTWVCPGTSSWNRFVPDLRAAEANIRRHAAAGKRYGADGLLNTEWGDDGHVAPPAGSWHPLTLGAAMAWNATGPPTGPFDRAFARLFLGEEGEEAVAAWRRAVDASNLSRIWPAFYAPLPEAQPPGGFDQRALRGWQSRANDAAEAFAAVVTHDPAHVRDRDELVLAFRLHALAGQRFLLARRLADRPRRIDATLAADLNDFADACEQIAPHYQAAWLARSKPSGLHEVTAVFQRLAQQARALAGQRSKA